MRVLTWNIRWGCGCDERVDLDRIAAVLRAHDADVVCLQEVAANHPGLAGSVGEDQIALLAGRFPRYSAHFAAGSDLAGDDGVRRLFGNMILSRLPVAQVLRHSLPWTAEAGAPSMPRVAIEAIIVADSGPLRVTTTHLEYYAPTQRAAQVRRLRELHEEAHSHAAAPPPPEDGIDPPFRHARRTRSAVLCGDFNCEPGSPEIQDLLLPFDGAPALKDAWTLAHGARPHAPTVGLHGCPWPDRAYCCDFFFVSEDLAPRIARVEVDAETAASDHQPVLLEIR